MLRESDLLQGGDAFIRAARGNLTSYTAIALDYAHAGLFAEAIDLLTECPSADPMLRYYVGWCLAQDGRQDEALAAFQQAAALSPDYCFPNEIECVPALQAAMQLNPQDAHAPHYLGNFWYAHRRYDEAIQAWERARELDPHFPTTPRNLGLAYYNQRSDRQRALQSYEQAFILNPGDARVFYELDQLRRRLNAAPADRLAVLEEHLELVERRDDLTIERVSLLNLLGEPVKALAILEQRRFHPWEGGEGKTTGQFVLSLVQLSRLALADGRYGEAIALLERAQVYPHNLGEGKLHGAQENHIFYYLGLAYRGLGDEVKAQASFKRAAVGLSEPSSALYYNDQPPDMIFYQGLARRALGKEAEAQEIFDKLIAYGREHLQDTIQFDYFAVSLPDFLVFDVDLDQRNRIHCHYMLALGRLGQGDRSRAEGEFASVLAEDASHSGATLQRHLTVAELQLSPGH